MDLTGASSWFGGPNDKTTGSTTASGAPITQPGIAVNNRSTLGGWWAIKAPNGTIGIVQQTDIGPAASTGRSFDYTFGLLPLFGYSQKTFPTGGQTNGVYLGKDITSASQALQGALTTLGANTAQNHSLITAFDAGPLGKGQASAYAVDTAGNNAASDSTGSTVSTTPSGDVQSAGLNVSVPGLSGLDSIAALLTSGSFWIRLGEAIAGVILLAMGLRSLTGTATTPVSVAKAAASKASKAAVL